MKTAVSLWFSLHPLVRFMAGYLCFALYLLGIWRLLTWMGRRWKWPPEISRKAAHVLLGLGTLHFLWMFEAAWMVWVVALGATLFLLWLRRAKNSAEGQILHGVARASYGDLCFPGSVALIYTLADGEPLFFIVPILVLSLADTAGALFGSICGRNLYQTEHGRKSWEGTAAVAGTTFFCVFLPLVWASPQALLEAAITAALAAFLVAIIESIALHGFDNLFVPWITLDLLLLAQTLDLSAKLERLVVALLCSLLVGRMGGRLRLRMDGILSGLLVLYLCFALKGWWGLLPPLWMGLTYWYYCRQAGPGEQVHGLPAIFSIAVPVLFWLLWPDRHDHSWYDFGFITVCASGSGLLALAGQHWLFAQKSTSQKILAAHAWTLPLLSLLPLHSPMGRTGPLWPQAILASTASCLVALAAWDRWEFSRPTDRLRPARWVAQGCASLLASGLATGILFFLR